MRDYEKHTDDELIALGICPDCHASLREQQGCFNCFKCGFSVCG